MLVIKIHSQAKQEIKNLQRQTSCNQDVRMFPQTLPNFCIVLQVSLIMS
jgi:hypothetical protein